ncbi:MAG: ATP-binding protein [Candidatus Omnitrophica bacterium]|nr:ATP-binding protein [Candidatus Omnitrophota bacterium]
MNIGTKTSFLLNNTAGSLKEVSAGLISALLEKGVAEGTVFEIQLSFEEALRNAMVHGNRERPDKKVKVEIEISEKDVRLMIEDEGEGFDLEKLPDPTAGDNLLRECGRGVYLIKHMMDEVRYSDGGRKVFMRKKIK